MPSGESKGSSEPENEPRRRARRLVPHVPKIHIGHAARQQAAAVVDEVPPSVIPRWLQPVLLGAALLFGWVIIKTAGYVVILFLVGTLVALVLNPFVGLLRRIRIKRFRYPRSLAVLTVYIIITCIVVGLGILLGNLIASEVTKFEKDLPKLVTEANKKLDSLQAWLDKNHIKIHIVHQGETAVQTIQNQLTKASHKLLSFTGSVVKTIVEAGFALILILVISIYMLLYGERIGALVRRVVPPARGTPQADFPHQIQRAVVGYVFGQLLFSAIMGTSAGLMLWIFGSVGIFPEGKGYAVFFGIYYALAELIPYVGPIIGAAPAVFFALVSHEPLWAVWLVLGFIVLQQLEGHVVAPNVFGQVLRINPLIVVFALLLGDRVYGLIGAFLALPVAAMVRQCIIYFNRHLVLEPWGTPSAAELVAAGASLRRPISPLLTEHRSCPICGAGVPTDKDECPVCGTKLPPS